MESWKLSLPLFSLFIFSLILGQGSADHDHQHQHHHQHDDHDHHHHHQHDDHQRQHHHHHHKFRPRKLFVFGDSYVDTGNIDISLSNAENFPYGITFPGKPTGRFSDGRVLTDFMAKFVRVRSPIPLNEGQKIGFRGLRVRHGINFAFGGTGVFDTSYPFPNMTSQIDSFEKLITDSVFTENDIDSSVVLVSVSGNDYSFYEATNGSAEGFRPFITSVVNQMTVNLKRIQSLGVKKIVVTGLGPLGCVPKITAPSSFTQCNQTLNSLVEFHNLLLNQAVDKLNTETSDSPFFILDFFTTFKSIIHNKGSRHGIIERFKTPLKPCCYGVSSEFSCGSVDELGNKKYVLCRNPRSAFFWDEVHPTQRGWFEAFRSLKSDLKQFF